ncbi:helix-turn-helix domain-containing protein [Mesorhizobium sp. L-8-3]|uniref:helix-turn-helix domain-containing protein n=1 Tax=Mesorhizobium sp. L-8-3 TaxID=2744522 RepID=UPI001926A6E2
MAGWKRTSTATTRSGTANISCLGDEVSLRGAWRWATGAGRFCARRRARGGHSCRVHQSRPCAHAAVDPAAPSPPPHAYIVDRRLARALIAACAEDLSAVAFATGFSSHAHLATAFRQRLGLSPSAFRRSLAGGGVAASHGAVLPTGPRPAR